MLRTCRRDNVFLDHDATNDIRARMQATTSPLDTLRQPGHLYVGDVVEIKPRNSEPTQVVIDGETIGDETAQRRSIGLKSPGDKRDETTRTIL